MRSPPSTSVSVPSGILGGNAQHWKITTCGIVHRSRRRLQQTDRQCPGHDARVRDSGGGPPPRVSLSPLTPLEGHRSYLPRKRANRKRLPSVTRRSKRSAWPIFPEVEGQKTTTTRWATVLGAASSTKFSPARLPAAEGRHKRRRPSIAISSAALVGQFGGGLCRRLCPQCLLGSGRLTLLLRLSVL
jgi:hypothetical protein